MNKKILFVIIMVAIIAFTSADTIVLNNDDNSEASQSKWDSYTKDDVFKELKYSKNGKAEFTMDNIDSKSEKNSKLEFDFIEDCGSVVSYKIFVNSTCTREVPKYYKKYLCHDKDDEQFFDLPLCLNETFENGTESVYYDCWKEVEEIPSGEKNYKLEADIKMENCGEGYGYKIDWIPTFELDSSNKFVGEKWAWWNVSYNYKRNITSIPTFKTMYPLNGSVVSDIDGDGTTDQYYGFAGADAVLYYNDENDTVLINSSNESIYLVQTLPKINTSGTPPTDIALFYPMDDSGGKAIDFSDNSANGTLTNTTEGSTGIYGKGYKMIHGRIIAPLDLDGTYTISAWFKKNATFSSYVLDARSNSGAGYSLVNHDNYVFYQSSGTTYVNGVTANSLPYNSWVFFTIAGINLNSNGEFHILSRYEAFSGNAGSWGGGVDNFMIHEGTLTQTEIETLYNSSKDTIMMLDSQEEAPVVDTCTCAGLDTDWEIDMSDHCNITANCDLGTGTLSFTGAGYMNCNATINTTDLGDPGSTGQLNIQEACIVYVD